MAHLALFAPASKEEEVMASLVRGAEVVKALKRKALKALKAKGRRRQQNVKPRRRKKHPLSLSLSLSASADPQNSYSLCQRCHNRKIKISQ